MAKRCAGIVAELVIGPIWQPNILDHLHRPTPILPGWVGGIKIRVIVNCLKSSRVGASRPLRVQDVEANRITIHGS